MVTGVDATLGITVIFPFVSTIAYLKFAEGRSDAKYSYHKNIINKE